MNWERTSTEGQVMGVIGIVLGVLSLIVAFIPCIGIVALVPGLLAIAFSIISIVQATQGNGTKGLGIAALVISSLSVLLAILWLLLIGGGSAIARKALDSKNWSDFNVEYEYRLQDSVEKSEVDTIRANERHIQRLRELEGDE